jgi:cell division protein FtsQ
MSPAAGRSTEIHDATTLIRTHRRQATRRRLKRILGVVAIFLVIAVLIWLIWFSPALVARSVDVQGTSQISSQDVVQAANVPLGTPLVRLDTEAIKQRVLDLPPIEEVSVHRTLTGVVRIQVQEARPAYAIHTDGHYLIVSDEGRGYLTADTQGDLIVVTIAHDDSPSSGRLMKDAATIVLALPEVVSSDLVSLSGETPDSFTIVLRDGRRILWGSSEESELKAQVITGLLDIKATYYDVSSPSHPSTR